MASITENLILALDSTAIQPERRKHVWRIIALLFVVIANKGDIESSSYLEV